MSVSLYIFFSSKWLSMPLYVGWGRSSMFLGAYCFLLFAVEGRALVGFEVFDRSGTGSSMKIERDSRSKLPMFDLFVMWRTFAFIDPTKTALFGRFFYSIFRAYGSIVKSPAFSPFFMKYTGFTIGSVLSFFLCCIDLQFSILFCKAFHSLSC